MLESVVKSHASASLPYKLIIAIIVLQYRTDISAFLVVEVSAIYDSKTFASMEYVLLDNE